MGRRPEQLADWCGDVEAVAEVLRPQGQPWENGPILVCRAPRTTLQEAWPELWSF